MLGPRPRVVLACPDTSEAALLTPWLSDAHDIIPVRTVGAVVQRIQAREADLIVADRRFALDDALLTACRRGTVKTPLLVIGEPSPSAEAAAERAGAYYATRPLDRDVLMCTAAMALMENRPVRRSPRKRVARFDSLVEGHSTALLDVSNEGMRLEVPRSPRGVPLIFTVRIPLVGICLRVHRVWVAPAPQPCSDGAIWCGGTLAENGAREQREWRKFVDLIPRAS